MREKTNDMPGGKTKATSEKDFHPLAADMGEWTTHKRRGTSETKGGSKGGHTKRRSFSWIESETTILSGRRQKSNCLRSQVKGKGA